MMPVVSIERHGDKLVTADKKQVRISPQKNIKEIFLNFDVTHDLNQIIPFYDSGLFLAANEYQKCGVFFIPSLGHAPKFCEFIENFTEEFESDQKTNKYDDFKFITYNELLKMNATHLIGSNKLKAHLHGYQISKQLYESLRSSEQNFNYEDYKKNKIEEALKKQV